MRRNLEIATYGDISCSLNQGWAIFNFKNEFSLNMYSTQDSRINIIKTKIQKAWSSMEVINFHRKTTFRIVILPVVKPVILPIVLYLRNIEIQKKAILAMLSWSMAAWSFISKDLCVPYILKIHCDICGGNNGRINLTLWI